MYNFQETSKKLYFNGHFKLLTLVYMTDNKIEGANQICCHRLIDNGLFASGVDPAPRTVLCNQEDAVLFKTICDQSINIEIDANMPIGYYRASKDLKYKMCTRHGWISPLTAKIISIE